MKIFKSMLCKTLAAMLLMHGLGSAAMACSLFPDSRSLEQRRAEAPVVFVGVVTALSTETTTWAVEYPMRGTTSREMVLKNSNAGTCGISFEVGDRWLFAGDFAANPSIRLGSKSQPPPRLCETKAQCGKGESCVGTTQKTACGPSSTCAARICLPG